MSNSKAAQALNNSGLLAKVDKTKHIINGTQTITPIISAMIQKGTMEKKGEISTIMMGINNLSACILKEAVDKGFEVTSGHFVSINRLAIKVYVNSYVNEIDIPSKDIACHIVELFKVDDIHSERLNFEMTNDDFTLQFISSMRLTTVIATHFIESNNLDITEDDLADTVLDITEIIDQQLDSLIEDYIEPSLFHIFRNNIFDAASDILESTFNSQSHGKTKSQVNLHLVKKMFEVSLDSFIQALILTIKPRPAC